jgi:type IV pilus assembly protein PilA
MSIVKQRMKKDSEEGFTLIELMVVVLILGILMAIAIPTFLSLTNSAKKNAAQADLTTAVTDAAVYFTANGDYGADTETLVAALSTADANIQWVDDSDQTATVTAGTRQVLVNVVKPTELQLGVLDKTGNYYWVDDNSGGTTYSNATTDNTIPTDFPNTSMP